MILIHMLYSNLWKKITELNKTESNTKKNNKCFSSKENTKDKRNRKIFNNLYLKDNKKWNNTKIIYSKNKEENLNSSNNKKN